MNKKKVSVFFEFFPKCSLLVRNSPCSFSFHNQDRTHRFVPPPPLRLAAKLVAVALRHISGPLAGVTVMGKAAALLHRLSIDSGSSSIVIVAPPPPPPLRTNSDMRAAGGGDGAVVVVVVVDLLWPVAAAAAEAAAAAAATAAAGGGVEGGVSSPPMRNIFGAQGQPGWPATEKERRRELVTDSARITRRDRDDDKRKRRTTTTARRRTTRQLSTLRRSRFANDALSVCVVLAGMDWSGCWLWLWLNGSGWLVGGFFLRAGN